MSILTKVKIPKQLRIIPAILFITPINCAIIVMTNIIKPLRANEKTLKSANKNSVMKKRKEF